MITNGTEKQIAWANTIRTNMIMEAETYVATLLSEMNKLVASGKRTDEQYQATIVLYKKAIRTLSGQTKAAYYINNRDKMINKIVDDCAKTLPEYQALVEMLKK